MEISIGRRRTDESVLLVAKFAKVSLLLLQRIVSEMAARSCQLSRMLTVSRIQADPNGEAELHSSGKVLYRYLVWKRDWEKGFFSTAGSSMVVEN
jgi:hypothetical protein